MIASKFGIGQQVRHKILGYLGVIIDIDPEYSLDKPCQDNLEVKDSLRMTPWYHVVMEDEAGKPVYKYLAEEQLGYELFLFHPEHPTLDELAKSICQQFLSPCLIH